METEVIVEELYNIDSDIIEKDDIYQCSTCTFSFNDITDVNEHIQKYHDANYVKIIDENEQDIILEELEETADDDINLTLVVKNPEGKYECNECHKSFKIYKRFVAHLKSHNSLMVEDYSELEEGTSRKRKLIEYEEILEEDGPKIFRCKSCLAEFDSRKRLLLHLSIHKNVKEAQNKECQVKQASDAINCNYCNKTFTNKLEFDLHIQAHEEKASNSSKQVLETKKPQTSKKGAHICQYCGKEFKRPHEKVKHERIHSGVKPYSCDICGKKFRVTYCLSLHKRNVHSDDRPYICTFPGCNKSFKAQSVYNHHINTHSDERKFQCPFCPKTFKTAVQLAGHKNTHNKPFSCTICKRPFSSLYAVKNHMEIHNTEDSLKMSCKICGAQYARSFALKDHLKTAHPGMETETEEYIIETETEADSGENELYSVVIEDADN